MVVSSTRESRIESRVIATLISAETTIKGVEERIPGPVGRVGIEIIKGLEHLNRLRIDDGEG